MESFLKVVDGPSYSFVLHDDFMRRKGFRRFVNRPVYKVDQEVHVKDLDNPTTLSLDLGEDRVLTDVQYLSVDTIRFWFSDGNFKDVSQNGGICYIDGLKFDFTRQKIGCYEVDMQVYWDLMQLLERYDFEMRDLGSFQRRDIITETIPRIMGDNYRKLDSLFNVNDLSWGSWFLPFYVTEGVRSWLNSLSDVEPVVVVGLNYSGRFRVELIMLVNECNAVRINPIVLIFSKESIESSLYVYYITEVWTRSCEFLHGIQLGEDIKLDVGKEIGDQLGARRLYITDRSSLVVGCSFPISDCWSEGEYVHGIPCKGYSYSQFWCVPDSLYSLVHIDQEKSNFLASSDDSSRVGIGLRYKSRIDRFSRALLIGLIKVYIMARYEDQVVMFHSLLGLCDKIERSCGKMIHWEELSRMKSRVHIRNHNWFDKIHAISFDRCFPQFDEVFELPYVNGLGMVLEDDALTSMSVDHHYLKEVGLNYDFGASMFVSHDKTKIISDLRRWKMGHYGMCGSYIATHCKSFITNGALFDTCEWLDVRGNAFVVKLPSKFKVFNARPVLSSLDRDLEM